MENKERTSTGVGMRKIAVINQKGGVGKTTTTVNLGAALALAGNRVCILDLDPQAHATTHLGTEPNGENPSVYDVLVGGKSIQEVLVSPQENLRLVPSDINLAGAEVELAGVVGREVILREALERCVEPFDYILMDCGPSLGVLTLNALAAADEVFIPLQPHFFALHGQPNPKHTQHIVSRRINAGLHVTGIVICLYDSSVKLTQEVVGNLKSFLDKSRGMNVPWKDATVFDTKIRRNIKLAECPSFGKSIFEYAPNCAGALDYAALANEVAGRVELQEIPMREEVAAGV